MNKGEIEDLANRGILTITSPGQWGKRSITITKKSNKYDLVCDGNSADEIVKLIEEVEKIFEKRR